MLKKLHILLLGFLLSFAVGASEITAGLKGYRLAVAIASMTTDASNVILNNTNQKVLKETLGEDFVKNWQTITAIGDAALLGSMTVTAFRNNSTQSAEALALWNQNKTKLEGKNLTLAQNVEKIIENEDMLRGGARLVEGADEMVNLAISRGSKTTWERFLASNSHLSTEDASNSYIKLIEKESPWPEGFIPNKSTMKEGKSFQMALDNSQPINSPGRFGTTDNITSVDYVRNKLAVKSKWKTDCSKVVEYRVKKGMELPVQTGPVGPQIDLIADKVLPGGGTQIFIDLPKGANIMDYIEVVPGSVITIK